jgi:two-component system response regulator TtrR
MQHVVAGMSNKDIAELLGLSSRTIEVHRHNLMKKMGAESLVDLVHKYDSYNQAGK